MLWDWNLRCWPILTLIIRSICTSWLGLIRDANSVGDDGNSHLLWELLIMAPTIQDSRRPTTTTGDKHFTLRHWVSRDTLKCYLQDPDDPIQIMDFFRQHEDLLIQHSRRTYPHLASFIGVPIVTSLRVQDSRYMDIYPPHVHLHNIRWKLVEMEYSLKSCSRT